MAIHPLLPLAPSGETSLLARARRGDTAARDELLGECRRRAYLLALQLLGNPDDALDVAQEAVLRILRSFDRLDAGRPVAPYLARIVTNLARDTWRRAKVRRAESLDDLVAAGGEPSDVAAGPEEAAGREEEARLVARALAGLPAAHREILVLRDYNDLSYAEIAAALAIPIGTVMSRLHRARTLLRSALRPSGGER